MPLQIGSWNFNDGGHVIALNVTSVDPSGLVGANFAGQPIAGGFWDEITQRLTFIIGNSPLAVCYVGFLTPDPHRMPAITGDGVAMLIGYATNLEGIPARRSGWYAQIGTT